MINKRIADIAKRKLELKGDYVVADSFEKTAIEAENMFIGMEMDFLLKLKSDLKTGVDLLHDELQNAKPTGTEEAAALAIAMHLKKLKDLSDSLK